MMECYSKSVRRGKGRKPTKEQAMIILKYGLDPYYWNVVWESEKVLSIYNRVTMERDRLEL